MNEMFAPEPDEFASSQIGFALLVGQSPTIRRVYDLITKVRNANYPVLILGETGTGKELVARSIHFFGKGPAKPFVPVDCLAFAPTLIESELYGYVKGAFSGAFCSRQGLVESADGGTLFLDEVGDLPLDLQAKLLRIIQEGELRPLGSTARRTVSVRFVAATNQHLELLAREGKFREDLYYRLNVVQIELPPLRDRRNDIPLLVRHFLKTSTICCDRMWTVSDEAMQRLLDYPWPGYVRELENALEHACALASGPVLEVRDLPEVFHDNGFEHVVIRQQPSQLEELETRAVLRACELIATALTAPCS